MNDDLFLSPSIHHRHVLDTTKQALVYTGGDAVAWQKQLRSKFVELLGEMPVEPGALQIRRLWTRRHPFGSIEKIIYRSEPYCDVPAYLCLPDVTHKPESLFICLQGHSTGMHNSIAVERDNEGKAMVVPGDRDFAIGCMKRGIAAFCIEQRSLGLRREVTQEKVSSNGCHDAFVQALMLGRTLMGERIFDIQRGIAALAELGYRNLKIGIMGNSGGGTSSIYAAAVIPEIDYAMPSCAFGLFRSSKMALYHCACGYVPKLLCYAEMPDIMGLFAPKPVVIVAGQDDPIVPLQSVRDGFDRLQSIYRAFGAEKRCQLVIGSGGHRFYADDAWPVMLDHMS